MTTTDDLANRSTDIHSPGGFSAADAYLFTHIELHIDVPNQWRNRPTV